MSAFYSKGEMVPENPSRCLAGMTVLYGHVCVLGTAGKQTGLHGGGRQGRKEEMKTPWLSKPTHSVGHNWASGYIQRFVFLFSK